MSLSDFLNSFGTFFQDLLNIFEQGVNWLEGWVCGLSKPMALAFIAKLPDLTGVQNAFSAFGPYVAWANQWIALDLAIAGLVGYVTFFVVYFVVKLVVRLF